MTEFLKVISMAITNVLVERNKRTLEPRTLYWKIHSFTDKFFFLACIVTIQDTRNIFGRKICKIPLLKYKIKILHATYFWFFLNFHSQLSGFVFNFNLNFDKVKHGKLTILFM